MAKPATTPRKKAAPKAEASAATEPRSGPEAAADAADEEVTLEEPGRNRTAGSGAGPDEGEPAPIADKNTWMRGLQMLIIAVLMGAAGWVLGLATLLQFGWLLFAGNRNDHIASFGADLADWFARAARFQTAATEDKPFPWAKWGRR